jgi:DNA anti-recombination protein RmuC
MSPTPHSPATPPLADAQHEDNMRAEPPPLLPVADRQLAEIRDLLFGEQMRTIQNVVNDLQSDLLGRIEALTLRLAQNIEQTRRDFSVRLDELAQHVDLLNRNQESRLASDIDEVAERIQQLQQASDTGDQKLEQQLEDMATTLNQSISSRAQELQERLTQTQLELRNSKADRKTLAGLLDRMATELNQDN